MNTYERQLLAEHEMHLSGVQRYRAQVSKANEHGRGTSTGPTRWLMRNALSATELAIESWRTAELSRSAGRHSAALTLLRGAKADVLAFITARTVLDSLTTTKYKSGFGRIAFNSLAFRVAGAVLRERRWEDYQKKYPDMFKEFKRRLAGRSESHRDSFFGRVVRDMDISVTEWTKPERLRVGTAMLELFLEATNLATKERFSLRRKGHFRYELCLSERTVEWMEASHTQHESMAPVYLPMLVPPLQWTTPYDGGYLSNALMREPLLTKRQNLRDTSQLSDEVRDAVNHLQETPWRIHPDLFQVVTHFWDTGHGVADMVPADDLQLPPVPQDEGTEDQRRAHARKCAEVHKVNLSRRAARIRMIRTLDLAKRFQDDTFYFPMKLDFRGRVYPLPSFLSPQGDGLARGLLQFAEGHEVTLGTPAAQWLAIHGSNCWGFDKVSLQDRVDWAHDHEDEIRAVYQDPLDCLWWTEADKPWEFLAWALEWGSLQESGSVISHTPVAMDGSNNGLQIFSLLLRDTEGAEACNVLPGPVPQDVYQRVADRAWAQVQGSPDPLAERWTAWLPGGLPRAATKRPVMVLPYGGTLHSCREYVRDWARERALADPHRWESADLYKATNWLGDIIWGAIADTVPAAVRGMAWLHQVAQVTVDHGITLEWDAPTGFRVRQSYQKMKSRVIRTTVGEKVIRGSYQTIDNDSPDGRKQKNGIAPNFVHSLDAAAMARTVAYCREAAVGSLSMIHDSFACHAVEAELLARLLRESYVSVFEPDQLSLFRGQIQAQLPQGAVLPEVPTFGNLDPTALLQSPYFFS